MQIDEVFVDPTNFISRKLFCVEGIFRVDCLQSGIGLFNCFVCGWWVGFKVHDLDDTAVVFLVFKMDLYFFFVFVNFLKQSLGIFFA